MPHPTDAALFDLAQRQQGFFTTAQAIEAGASHALLSRRVRAGRLLRPLPGLFRVPGCPLRPTGPLWMATLKVPSAAVDRLSAAWLIGTQVVPSAPKPSIVVPHGSNPRLGSATEVRQTVHLPASDVIRRDGLPVTSPARTVVDLSGVIGRARLRSLVDEWVVDHKLGPDQLEAKVAAMSRSGRQGLSDIRIILDELLSAPSAGPGFLERVLLDVCSASGIPVIAESPLPTDATTNEFCDAFAPGALLVLEADGRATHARRQQMAKDRARDREAAARGIQTIRFTTHELLHSFETCVEEARRIYETRLHQLSREAS